LTENIPSLVNNHKENKAPATAIGTVKMIMKGSMKLQIAAKIKILIPKPIQMQKQCLNYFQQNPGFST
jgi:hypothetical protein